MSKKKCISIIQPSFFPYLGYFQMINASDVFVFYDHVQYDKNGWRNRNRILIDEKIKWITLPAVVDEGKIIKNVKILRPDYNLSKIFKTIKQNYNKAPNFIKTIQLLEEIFFYKNWIYLSDFNIFSTKKICEHLEINSNFYKSSDMDNIADKNLNLINICKKFNCSNYLSGKLAKNYINQGMFEKNDVKIEWFNFNLNTNNIKQKEYLSIIDYLFNKNFVD